MERTVRGNVLYEPDGRVLTEYLWSRDPFCCIQGPIGSGTSTASCHRIWLQACEQEPDFDGVRRTRWIVSRDTYKNLRETTIKTWLDWFPEQDWGPIIRSEPMFHHLKRPHPSGDKTRVDCEVIFVAIPDPDVAEKILASYEITGFFVNEGQFFEKAVIDELLSRCSRYPSMKGGPGATWFGGFMDMNAPSEGHWVPYMRGDIPVPSEFTESEKKALVAPATWKFLVQPPGLIETSKDGEIVYQPNPEAENQKHLRETYMEKVVGKQKDWIDRRVLNKVGLYNNGKSVYPTFMEADHVHRKDVRPIKDAPIIVGLDFGREPAAVFCQCVNQHWVVLSELIGDNESAERFAPRVVSHLSRMYPGHKFEAWGDPRGADRGQNSERTAYDVFQGHGIRVMPATTDNNPEMRRSAVEKVLGRRNGFRINASCMVLKIGMAGGYHYPRIKGIAGLYSDKPRKNKYSHVVEALENALLGGGEGHQLIAPRQVSRTPSPSAPKPRRLKLRKAFP